MTNPLPLPPKNTFGFSCPECRQPVEARLQDRGGETECPSCHAPITIPRIATNLPRIAANPYSRPIGKICGQMASVPWTFPFFPQLIQLAVLALVLCLFGVLYITIGIVSQIKD